MPPPALSVDDSRHAPQHDAVAIKPLVLALALAYAADVQAQPPAPTPERNAPPLPFRYVGQVSVNGKHEVLLMRGERLFALSPGQQVDAQYRVERVTASVITFTYLPLGLSQNLELPGAR